MRIAYLCADPGIPVFGCKGASIHVQEVIRAMRRRGVDVHLFATRVGGAAPADLADLPVTLLPNAPQGADAAVRELALLAANDALAAALAGVGPFDLIYERYSLWSCAGMESAHRAGIPSVLEVNAPLIDEQARHRSLVHAAAAEETAVRAFGAASVLIAVSAGVADYLNRFPVAAGRVHVVANGVAVERFGDRITPALPADGKHFTVGFVGTLKAWHGLEVLVDAFALAHALDPALRLLIVGDGPGRPAVAAELAARGLTENVCFAGAVAHEAIPGWLASMDAALAPYPPTEAFYFSPLKLYEYMAAGLPTVASDLGQIAEVMHHAQNGLLCPPGDARAFAAAILRLKNDRMLASHLGAAARADVLAHHTWDAVVARIWTLAGLPALSDEGEPDEDESDEVDGASAKAEPTANLAASLPGLWRLVRRLHPYIGRRWTLLAASLAAMLATIGLRLVEPWPLKLVVDYLSGDMVALPSYLSSESMALAAAAAAIVLVSIGRAGAEYISTVAAALAGNRILSEVRADVYDHLLRLSLAYHDRAKSGDLLTRVINDTTRLQEVAVTALLPLMVSALTLLGMVGMMLWLDWRMALLSLIGLPLTWLSMGRHSRQIRTVGRKQRQRESAMAATASETLGAMRMVKAFGLEPEMARLFGRANRKSLGEGAQSARLAAGLERTVDICIAAGTALSVWYGARLVTTGTLSLGELIVFLSYLKSAFRPLRDLAKYTGRIAKATASGERILALLDTEPLVVDRADAVVAPPFAGRITFDRVTFGYGTERPALQDVSFSVAPGECVALVGPSGSGKSTISALLLRLYEPQHGSIRIDGRDIRDLTQASLRAQISTVFQQSMLFGVTVRENIRYGRLDASDDELIAAAATANAHDFICMLESGYDSALGERGATLSGGQQQRIAIARAAVRRAPIVILDEPTTGLDKANEHAVNAALEQLTTNGTTLLITHDLRAAARADRIIYLENGQVCEQGSHQQLIALDGRYARMVRWQNMGGVARSAPVHEEAQHALVAA